MYFKKLINNFFIFKLLSLLFANEIYCQNCQLKEEYMKYKWLFTIQNQQNQWEPLHTDQIANGSSIFLHCTGKQGKVKIIDCINAVFNPSLPQSDCTTSVNAAVDEVPTEPNCKNMNGISYEIRYHLNDGTNLELYTVCYNPLQELPLYVRNRAYGFQLQTPKYKGKDFAVDKVVTTERRDSFKPQNIHKTFKKPKRPKQKYITSDKDFIIQRVHLANAQDFLTYNQMGATYKHINVMPQFDKVNQGNWKTIENWIHRLPLANEYVTVLTGTTDILTLSPSSNTNQQVPMFLMDNQKTPIPLWIYKVVEHKGNCHVFVTLNDRFDFNKKLAPTAFCTEMSYPPGITFNKNYMYGKSYYCDYTKFKSVVGPHTAICG